MSIQESIEQEVKSALLQEYGVSLENIEFQPTRKDFEGDITIVTFPMLRQIKTNPVQLGQFIGESLVKSVAVISGL